MMPNALGLGHDYPGRTNSDSENASARASLQAGRNESGWDPAAPKAAHGTRGGSTAIFALLLSAALPVASYAAPVVEIASPVTGATVCGTITVSAAASDPNGIAGVQFQYNGTNIGSQATAVPYTTLAYTKNVADGIYTLTAVAQSSTGQYTTSAPVSVTVNNSASYCSPKFTPTFIAYYGAAPTITSTIAQAIGKYDLVDTHRYRYYDMSSPYTWAAIKATNPNTKIYLYEMGAEDENMDDSTSQEYLQGIDRYNISRGHSMGSLNGNNSAL